MLLKTGVVALVLVLWPAQLSEQMNHISDSLDEHWSTFKVNFYEQCFP